MEFSSHNFIKKLVVVVVLIFMGFLSACVKDDYSPALDNKGRRYNSKDLAKDWRTKFKDKQFPADNDAEYYYPKYKYIPGAQVTRPVRPDPYFNNKPYIHQQQPSGANYYDKPPVLNPHNDIYEYPQDNDAENAAGRYPKYDPEADNAEGLYPLLFE